MRFSAICLSAALLGAFPAAAEVTASSESGFVSHNEVLVAVSPAQAWAAMARPAEWWSPDHTYSGDAANLSLAPEAGGCFCEADPASGSHVEHMRVIYAAPGSILRLSGALGPLQAEAVTGVLTMSVTPDGEMTRISWDYVVGGYSRTPMPTIAPLVDQVIGEQLLRLAQRLGTTWDGAPRRGL